MALERINPQPLSNALTTTGAPSLKRLSAEDGSILTALLEKAQRRWPNQDTAESMEEYLADFERLSLKYSLPRVEAALAELRIRPGQVFFPRPEEVAAEIEDQLEREESAKRRQREQAGRARADRERWEWFDGRLNADGVVMVNGALCRTDEEFLKAALALLPRDQCGAEKKGTEAA